MQIAVQAHSTGPWELVESVTHLYILGTKADGEDFRPFVVQRQKTCFSPSEEARIKADMALIQAAPDMLAALKAVLVDCADTDAFLSIRVAQTVREAIAKAES